MTIKRSGMRKAGMSETAVGRVFLAKRGSRVEAFENQEVWRRANFAVRRSATRSSYMRRVLRTLLPISVCASPVLAFLAIPTIASAHGGNNDPNVVHACIGNVSKIVRIVGLSGVCLASPPLVVETPAHWDIQGLPGAPGVNGTN